MDFQKDIEIDQNALDQEWIAQPVLYMRYAELEAEARRTMDEEKVRSDVVRAKLDAKIRENPEDYGISKVTEGSILSAIQQDEDYLESQTALRTAKYQLDMISGAVRALDHRRKALENLVYLHGQSYFSEPSTKRLHQDDKEAIDNVKKKASRELVRRRSPRRTASGED